MREKPVKASEIEELLTVEDVANLGKFSKRKVYTDMTRGLVESVRVGRSRRISASAAQKYLSGGR